MRRKAINSLPSRITAHLPSQDSRCRRVDVARSDGEVEHYRVRTSELWGDWPRAPEIRIPARHHQRNLRARHLAVVGARASHGHGEPRGTRKLRRLRYHHLIPADVA